MKPVEGPGDLVLGPAGWQQRQHALGAPDPGPDLNRWSTDEVLAVYRTATGELRQRAAEELAERLDQATGGE